MLLPLAAYADRLSVRPGESVRFHVANATGEPVTAAVARVICADANPAGPGICLEALDANVLALSAPASQVSPLGSYATVAAFGGRVPGPALGLLCRVFPTLEAGQEQVLFACVDEARKTGFSLVLDAACRVKGTIGDGERWLDAVVNTPLVRRRWHNVWLSVDPDGDQVSVGFEAVDDPMSGDRTGQEVVPLDHGGYRAPASDTALMIAAGGAPRAARLHFTGKLESPVVVARAISDEDMACFRDFECPADVVAHWDFGREVDSSRVADVGPYGYHGRTVNSPYRAMTGANWRGQQMAFHHAPELYGAIHFHADDIDDCAWPATHEWTVPDGTRSGVYALTLQAGDVKENVPFHVVAPKGKRGADLAVLASTFTYTVYANHTRFEWDHDPQFRRDWHERAAAWGAYPYNPGDHREYGLSTYNVHVDGSGIGIASWHRPMLNVRIGYITYPHEEVRGSGLRHFPADTHLIAWLEAKGIEYDVVTDWELHTEGVDAIKDYRVLLTGSHPEYHTPATLDALEAYRDGGGRFAYLGGNGFYWKIAANPERPGVIEIRRGEGGIRAWAAEPGEYYNQFDGQYGGLWRRNGRPPQHLCGVGFTAQGNFAGSYYRKRAEAHDPRVAWMFEGVDGEILGNHGLSGHGAAGFELDRADKRLGTPRHALVVASSEGHPPEVPWILVPEEMLTHLATWPGEPADQLIRADMTFFETPAGGAVFSTGSITFCGSLVTNGFDNDISTLVANVVRRFLDPAPFQMPGAAPT